MVAVYIDNPRIPYRGMFMAHMIADTEQELHEMADAVGLRREWFQDKAKYPHYDLCASKRQHALRLGAIPLTSKQLVLKAQTIKK